jgi:integration host factor subunit beta
VHFKPGKAMREGLIAAAAGMTKAVPSSAAASSTASAEARAA